MFTKPQRSSNHTIEGAVFIHRANWDRRLASSDVLASDLLHGDAESNVRAQAFWAGLRPITTLVITSVMSVCSVIHGRRGEFSEIGWPAALPLCNFIWAEGPTGGDEEITISTRRFLLRPVRVSLVATGLVSAYPTALTRSTSIPLLINA